MEGGYPHDSSVSLSNSTYSGGDDNDNYGEMNDEYFNDNDSALGGSLIGHDTQTVASCMTDYRYENGRRYHAYRDGEYWVFSVPR